MAWVLTGGEDHALLATFPPDADFPEGWRVIGAVRAGENAAVLVGGEPADAAARAVGAEGTGHVHFG
jgi:thiamine-monophosphate kinase